MSVSREVADKVEPSAAAVKCIVILSHSDSRISCLRVYSPAVVNGIDPFHYRLAVLVASQCGVEVCQSPMADIDPTPNRYGFLATCTTDKEALSSYGRIVKALGMFAKRLPGMEERVNQLILGD